MYVFFFYLNLLKIESYFEYLSYLYTYIEIDIFPIKFIEVYSKISVKCVKYMRNQINNWI